MVNTQRNRVAHGHVWEHVDGTDRRKCKICGEFEPSDYTHKKTLRRY